MLSKKSVSKFSRNEPIWDYYQLLEELGRGSFSIVYKAKHRLHGTYHAIKVIDKEKMGEKKLELIETEIEILRMVDHPNIIKLEEIFETSTMVYLVMELITGGELFDKIVELQCYSEKRASLLVKQIISAVEHLHNKNIVHRDLKPENLLLSSLSEEAGVKLADFGLSTFVKPGQKLTKAVGTPGYIAPEILQTLDEDLDGYNKEVDMWSVGVILYILLCGFPPFYAEEDDEAFDQIIAGHFDYPAPFWTHISDEAKDLINHLLVVDASKRFTAEQVLQHVWITSNNRESHLEGTIEELKKFNTKLKWKKGIHGVMAIGRLMKLRSSSSFERSPVPSQSQPPQSPKESKETKETKESKDSKEAKPKKEGVALPSKIATSQLNNNATSKSPKQSPRNSPRGTTSTTASKSSAGAVSGPARSRSSSLGSKVSTASSVAVKSSPSGPLGTSTSSTTKKTTSSSSSTTAAPPVSPKSKPSTTTLKVSK